MAVMCSSGRNVIRSKKVVTSGWSAICLLFMLKNSALPGTNIGRMYCFSRRGFSQLYSSRFCAVAPFYFLRLSPWGCARRRVSKRNRRRRLLARRLKVAPQGRMRGELAAASRLWVIMANLPLISQRAGPLTASPEGEAFLPSKPSPRGEGGPAGPDERASLPRLPVYGL